MKKFILCLGLVFCLGSVDATLGRYYEVRISLGCGANAPIGRFAITASPREVRQWAKRIAEERCGDRRKFQVKEIVEVCY